MTQVKTRMNRGSRRPVAGREQILQAARAIGIRDGWKAVTIRAVAQELGYTAPLLYEHFQDKQEILTQLAVEGHVCLERELARDLPENSQTAILIMVERYWTFMLNHAQIYRLMNGMDGVPINKETLNSLAQTTFKVAGVAVRNWLTAEGVGAANVGAVVDEIWALLHGMAALYLDRTVTFDVQRAQGSVLKLLRGSSTVSFVTLARAGHPSG